jgi:hypothetical protein
MWPAISKDTPIKRCPEPPLASRQAPETAPKFLHHVAFEGPKVRNPGAEEDREQQQSVFRRLSVAALVSGAA